jgi:hypothetical protein
MGPPPSKSGLKFAIPGIWFALTSNIRIGFKNLRILYLIILLIGNRLLHQLI